MFDHPYGNRHLLDIQSWSKQDIVEVLKQAFWYREQTSKKLKTILSGQRVAFLFFEPSTRTFLSFEMAARGLGAEVFALPDSNSLSKGETWEDTILNVEAILNPDAYVIRHSENEAPHQLSKMVRGSVINAGDGAHQHPTQALLDAMTLLDHYQRTPEEGLEGICISIIGDISHSRVANSNMHLLPKLGVKVRITGPKEWLSKDIPEGVEKVSSLEQALCEADGVMMLRIQKERIGNFSQSRNIIPVKAGIQEEGLQLDPRLREGDNLPIERKNYLDQWGMTKERFERLSEKCVLMHPGPVNWGTEIEASLQSHPRSLILKQAACGTWVRMAVLGGLLWRY